MKLRYKTIVQSQIKMRIFSVCQIGKNKIFLIQHFDVFGSKLEFSGYTIWFYRFIMSIRTKLAFCNKLLNWSDDNLAD